MLLSKPKKSYKSVSKTDLMADEQKDQEEEQKIDIFAYEEMNITQDSVRAYVNFPRQAWASPYRGFSSSDMWIT